MLLRTLGACLLENISIGRGRNRARERIVRAGYGNKKIDFYCRFILRLILRYKNIIKLNLDLMVFILEIIYPK